MSHPDCIDGHVCQVPSGKACIEPGCALPAGTRWGPYWCPDHDRERLDRITASLTALDGAAKRQDLVKEMLAEPEALF